VTRWAFPIILAIAGWPYVLFGFALGSLPFGLLISRAFFSRDIRASGSGNIGAANALRTLGKKAGAAVLALDACKGALAVAVAWHQWLFIPLVLTTPGTNSGTELVPLAGLAAVLGHCYPPWLRFRGGKGVATFLGAAFALSWESGIAFVAVWLAVVIPTGLASLGSMAGAIVAGAVLIAAGARYGESGFVFVFASALVIIWKHRENLGRLRSGTENQLTLFKR